MKYFHCELKPKWAGITIGEYARPEARPELSLPGHAFFSCYLACIANVFSSTSGLQLTSLS
jgi:hypothetical protein